MREFFVGQAVDLEDFFAENYNHPSARTAICTESSGTIEANVSSTWQSGRFIVDERSLGRMRYGQMMKRIGLDFSLHWRIMRALLEFEEARKELLRVRGITAKQLQSELAKGKL